MGTTCGHRQSNLLQENFLIKQKHHVIPFSPCLEQKNNMQCPECGTQQKNTIESRCRCGYQFIFQGKTAQGMTDITFRRILQRAGQGGILHFTFPQLYTAWCQQHIEEKYSLLRKQLIAAGGLLSLLSAGCFFFFGWLAGLMSLFSLVIPWFILRKYHQLAPPSLEHLKNSLKKWQAGNGGGDETLLLQPSLHSPPPDSPEKDIFDYGVEKIIIVERPLLVDLLVKNGFYSDHNALIFSRDGYPDYITQRAQRLLKLNSSLPIYILHDASEAGMTMSQKKKLAGRTVIDLGINQDDLKKMPFLDALQLHKKDYKAPLDILPYPVLAAIFGEALREKRKISEILKEWGVEKTKNPFLRILLNIIGSQKTQKKEM